MSSFTFIILEIEISVEIIKNQKKLMIRNLLHLFLGFLLFWSAKWGFEGLDLFFESQNTGGKELGALGEAIIAFFLLFISFITLLVPLIYFTTSFNRKEFPKTKAMMFYFSGFILTFAVMKFSDEWQIHKEVSTHVENSKKTFEYLKKNFQIMSRYISL